MVMVGADRFAPGYTWDIIRDTNYSCISGFNSLIAEVLA